MLSDKARQEKYLHFIEPVERVAIGLPFKETTIEWGAEKRREKSGSYGFCLFFFIQGIQFTTSFPQLLLQINESPVYEFDCDTATEKND